MPFGNLSGMLVKVKFEKLQNESTNWTECKWVERHFVSVIKMISCYCYLNFSGAKCDGHLHLLSSPGQSEKLGAWGPVL